MVLPARTINSTKQASQSYQPQTPIQTHHASPVATTHIPHTPVRMPASVFPPPPQPQQPPVAVPEFSYTPVQQATFKQFDRFFHLAKQFSLTALVSFLVFFTGSLVFDWLFHAQGVFTRIGMLFSFIALSCGLFFFLYSLKYYLTVALILSYSRQTGEESSGQGNGSFFARLFGLSPPARVAAHKSGTKPLWLLSDLTGVQLERTPFVSIQVATYNEKRVIDRFLLAVTSMEYQNYEIIVADDSTDETVQLLEQWKNHPKVKISHRTTREGFKGGALKEALKLTDPRAEFLLIFDADFIPYPDTITQFLKYFQASVGSLQPEKVQVSPVAAVQGYQWHILNKSENWITKGVRSEYAGSYVMERAGTELYRGLEQISGSVYMIRKDVLTAIGWGTSLTEDFELTLELYAKGYKVVYTPYLQAPAEAASTIKRLIRQRMRWAEGHSFNIKRMFWKLLLSPKLTGTEKFEFLYLSPYYLQAFLFLLGTICWFIAEVIFRVRLPFWPETFGWSLVFTNMLALPLMNMVGLFFEQAQERDYLGLFSFILISYIIAPFQAFAAVKGFLEKEEGPWFRTPKTGKITDNFTPGRLYRFISGILGKPAVSNFMGRSGAKSIPVFSESPYLAMAGINNQLDANSVRSRRSSRWRGRSILAAYLLIVIFLNYFTFSMPKQAYATGGNPTIEQQINILDQTINSSTTLTNGATGIVYIDPSVYSGTVNYYFDAVANISSGSNTVVLRYNASTNATVNNSTTNVSITVNSATMTDYRVTINNPVPSSGNAYIYSVGAGITVQAARIIVVQNDPNDIAKTQTQIELGSNESASPTVQLDSSSTKSSDFVTSVTNISWSHTTISQSNTFLMVEVNTQNGTGSRPTVTAITYAGTNLTKLAAVNMCSPYNREELWYLGTANNTNNTISPAPGTNTITVTVNHTTPDLNAAAVVFKNVASFGNWTSANSTGNTASVNLTNTTTSQVVYDALDSCDPNTSGQTIWWNPGTNQTQIYQDGAGEVAGSIKSGTSTSTTMNWTQVQNLNNYQWSEIAVALNPSTGDNRLQNPKYWYYNKSKYDSSGNYSVAFEATLWNSDVGSNTTATLYQAGSNCTTGVGGSLLNMTGTTPARIRSPDISANLTTNTTYMVCIDSSANTAYLSNAKLIISQTSTGGLTAMEMQHMYINQPEVSNSTTNQSLYYINQYTPANWNGGNFAYIYQAAARTWNDLGYTQIYNTGNGSTISGSVNTTNTSDTLIQSGSLTMPQTTTNLDVQISSSNASIVPAMYTSSCFSANCSGNRNTTVSLNITNNMAQNAALLVSTAVNSTSVNVTTITYAGTSLTFIGQKASSTQDTVELWALSTTNGLTTGTNTLTVNFSGNTLPVVSVAVMYNFDQQALFGSTVSASGTSSSPAVNVTNTNTNQTIIGALATYNKNNVNPNDPGVFLWYKYIDNGYNLLAGLYQPGAAINTNISWTDAGSEQWAALGVPMNSASTPTIEGSWLVIDVSNLSTPENILFLLPLLIFLPKIMESINKRQKLKLAMQHSLLVSNITALRARKQFHRTRSCSPDPG